MSKTNQIRAFFEANPHLVYVYRCDTTGQRKTHKFDLELLKRFAKFWMNLEGNRKYGYGLCSNFDCWCNAIINMEGEPYDDSIYDPLKIDAMKKMFWVVVGGNDPVIDMEAFKKARSSENAILHYPFGGERSFDEDLRHGCMHKNPKRIAFIQAILEA